MTQVRAKLLPKYGEICFSLLLRPTFHFQQPIFSALHHNAVCYLLCCTAMRYTAINCYTGQLCSTLHYTSLRHNLMHFTPLRCLQEYHSAFSIVAIRCSVLHFVVPHRQATFHCIHPNHNAPAYANVRICHEILFHRIQCSAA